MYAAWRYAARVSQQLPRVVTWQWDDRHSHLRHVVITYLPVCETRKSAAQNSQDNWKRKHFLFQTDCVASWSLLWLLRLINTLNNIQVYLLQKQSPVIANACAFTDWDKHSTEYLPKLSYSLKLAVITTLLSVCCTRTVINFYCLAIFSVQLVKPPLATRAAYVHRCCPYVCLCVCLSVAKMQNNAIFSKTK